MDYYLLLMFLACGVYSVNAQCSSSEHACPLMNGRNGCIMKSQVCDHVVNCRDGSDENVCTDQPDYDEDYPDWFGRAQAVLANQVYKTEQPLNTKPAKNVILFLGDAMGLSAVTTGRIFKGQLRGEKGEMGFLTFEKFPHTALSKTFAANKQVTDSAGSATAYLCGEKAPYATVGVNQYVTLKDCQSEKGNHIDSILQWSQDAGKATGFVTTTKVTHATVASGYAHSAYRLWEGDFGDKEAEAQLYGCEDIASQLVHGKTGSGLKVAMGGGRKHLYPNTEPDPEYPEKMGARVDGRNLVNEWKNKKMGMGSRAKYVWNRDEMMNVDAASTDYLLGVFDPSYMKYELDRAEDRAGEPSFAEMTEKAIEILSKDDDGFFLLAEGGQIDVAHHFGLAQKSMMEVVQLDLAVEKALQMVNLEETLIVVTADHSSTFVLAGYQPRGGDLLGTVYDAENDVHYTPLGYYTGPSGVTGNGLQDVTQENTYDKNYMPQAAIPMIRGVHGGEDVGIYAQGPMSHLFDGVVDHHYIAHAMAYASCVGANKAHCNNKPRPPPVAPAPAPAPGPYVPPSNPYYPPSNPYNPYKPSRPNRPDPPASSASQIRQTSAIMAGLIATVYLLFC